jgi:hypothetical protein
VSARAYKKNSLLILGGTRVTETSIRKRSIRCASSKEIARRVRRIYFKEILQI